MVVCSARARARVAGRALRTCGSVPRVRGGPCGRTMKRAVSPQRAAEDVMAQHAAGLDTAFEVAQRRQAAGALRVGGAPPAPSAGEDEEEYALRKRLAATQAEVERLRAARAQRGTASPSRGKLRRADSVSVASDAVIGELLLENTRSFLITLQHEDVARADAVLYERDGFDSNMPLPIALEAEPLGCLFAFCEQLAGLCGVRLDAAEQTRLPGNVHEVAWRMRGRAGAHEDEGSIEGLGAQAEVPFTASFRFDEKHGTVLDLRCDLADETRVELGETLVLVEQRACVRTLMAVLSQYAELHRARLRLWSEMQRRFPSAVRVVPAPPWAGPGAVQALRVRNARSGLRAWLFWTPVFSDSAREGGYLLRPSLALHRESAEPALAHEAPPEDERFRVLVRVRGLPGALETLILTQLDGATAGTA